MDPALIGALIGVGGTLVGVIATGYFSHSREKANRKHAVELKKLELEGQREQKWFDDRKEAYADLARVTSVIQTEKYVIGDVMQALARVQMVSNSTMTTEIANGLVNAWRLASKRSNEIRKQGKEIKEDEETRELIKQSKEGHAAFLAAARAELYGAPFDKGYGQWAIGLEGQPPQLEE